MGGGKRKQVAQRIKNNARPSSSGRSAELLHSATSTPQFTGLKDISFFSTALTSFKPEELDPTLDADFQMVFKKMNKKDCTTKLKALQEFSELVSKAQGDTIKSVMNPWCRIYTSFAMDSEHRIREAVQNAHHQIILKDKKAIAPYLKRIIGPWFTSQYDTYPPAASAAAKAFSATFPDNKTKDCIIFCQNEILTYIKNNLDAENVTNPKQFVLEDAEARLERIFISSLQGYSMYLTVLNADQIRDEIEVNNAIVSSAKFPKIASHKSAIVKGSWFKVLTAMYEKAPFLLADHHGRLIPLVFLNLDENDPTVVTYVWEAALLCITHVEEWWRYVNIEKVFSVKIFKVLREGGQGSAAVIYPNFLTLLSKLPPNIKDIDDFHEKFFENFRSGLERKSVIASKSEGAAVVTSLVECIQYVIMTNQSKTDKCKRFVQRHLLAVIERAFSETRLYDVTVIKRTAGLIQFWSKNQDSYSDIIVCFWNNLERLFDDVLRNVSDSEAILDLAEKQTNFLKVFKSGGIITKTREHCVKFSDPCDGHDVRRESAISSFVLSEKFENDLNCLVYVVLKSFSNLIRSKHGQIIDHFRDLVHTFKSEAFLKGLARHLCGSDEIISIFHTFLSHMLLKSDHNTTTVIELTFILLEYVEDDEKSSVLDVLTKVSDDYFELCIIHALSSKFREQVMIQKWLDDDRITNYLKKFIIVENFTLNDRLERLLSLILSNPDVPIFTKTLPNIVSIIQGSLFDPLNHDNLNSTICLATYVLKTLPLQQGNDCINCYQSIVLSLFTLSCDDSLSPQMNGEMNIVWKESIEQISKLLSKSDFIDFTTSCAKIIEDKFIIASSDCDNLTGVLIDYVRVVHKGRPILIDDVVDAFMSNEQLPKWEIALDKISQNTEYLLGNLCSPFDAVDDVITVENDILMCAIWTRMIIELLSSTLDDSDDDTDGTTIYDAIDDGCVIVAGFIHKLAEIKSFLNHHKTAKCYNEVSCSYAKIMKNVLVLVDKVKSQGLCGKMEEIVRENLIDNSWLWSSAIYLFHTEISPSDIVAVYRKYSNLSSLHLLQTFAKHLNFAHAPKLSNPIESIIISRSFLHCEEIDVQIAQVFGKIEKIREKNNANFLYDNNKLSWSEFEEVIETVRFFSVLIEFKFNELSRRHWDFSVISLVTWASNCHKNRSKYQRPQYQAFVIAIVNLYNGLVEQIGKLKQSEPKSSYVCEWEDLFFANVHNDLLQLWMYLADQFSESTEGLPHIFIQEFGKIIANFDQKMIFQNDGTCPNWSKLLKRSCELLLSPEPALQLWGYQMCSVLSTGLINIDMVHVNNDNVQEKTLAIENAFKDILQNTNQIVDDLLMAFKLGENSCEVEAFTDSYTYVHGYLLLWNILLRLCEKSPPALRYQYVRRLRHDNFIKSLLDNLFKLMPSEVLHYNEGKTRSCFDLFLKEPNFDLGSNVDECNSEKLEHLACWVYNVSLCQLPVVVRQWWSDLEPKIGQIVDKVTTFYVSPHLCNQELQDVTNHDAKFKNMTIKVLPSVREVIAIYTVDDAQMELTITLPINYPLGGPDVQCTRQIGGTAHKTWLMQLKKCLLHQNGRIWDGLSLWNNNLDKKFDGIEECYICFAVLHPGSYQLPKLSCQTCKKKFHSACLYKWFSTSNKSTCPICRNLF